MVLLPAQGLRAFGGKGKRLFFPKICPRQELNSPLKKARPPFRGRPQAGPGYLESGEEYDAWGIQSPECL